MWTDRATRLRDGSRPVDNRLGARSGGETARMSLEVPVLEVLDLADRLRAVAGLGAEAAAGLRAPGDGGALAAALDDFVAAFGVALRAMGAEAELLGDAAEATARSWALLDAGLLVRRGQWAVR